MKFAKVTLYGEPEKAFPDMLHDRYRKIKLMNEEHAYIDMHTGQKLESVTTFLGRKGLISVPPDVPAVRKAADRGKAIHEEISKAIKFWQGARDNQAFKDVTGYSKSAAEKGFSEMVSKEFQYKDEVFTFLEFLSGDIADGDLAFAGSEEVVWKWNMAGTIDVTYPDTCHRRVLLDVKTGKKPNLDACCLQLMFYSYLNNWNRYYAADRLLMAHIVEDAMACYVEITEFCVDCRTDKPGWKLVDNYFKEQLRSKGKIFIKVTDNG